MTPLLETQGLAKSYGALAVTDDVSLTVLPGEIHAIIGPNGAGKTTLIAQITGELAPDRGRVLFDGNDIGGLAPWRRARLGLARTFQITTLLPEMTALDNVALAVQARSGTSFRFFGAARGEATLRALARAELARASASRRQPTRGAPTCRTASTGSSSSPSRSPSSRSCCCSTSRWPASATPIPAD